MIKMQGAGMTLGLVGILAAGCGGVEKGKSYLIRHASVPLHQAVGIAETSIPGRAVKAELESSGSRVMYQVEIVDAINRTRTVWIDAETGKLIKVTD